MYINQKIINTFIESNSNILNDNMLKQIKNKLKDKAINKFQNGFIINNKNFIKNFSFFNIKNKILNRFWFNTADGSTHTINLDNTLNKNEIEFIKKLVG